MCACAGAGAFVSVSCFHPESAQQQVHFSLSLSLCSVFPFRIRLSPKLLFPLCVLPFHSLSIIFLSLSLYPLQSYRCCDRINTAHHRKPVVGTVVAAAALRVEVVQEFIIPSCLFFLLGFNRATYSYIPSTDHPFVAVCIVFHQSHVFKEAKEKDFCHLFSSIPFQMKHVYIYIYK